MRKGLFCLLAALLLLPLFSVAAAEEDNLIVNGDFSQVENGLPVGWYTYAYFSDAGITHFSCEDGAAQIYNLDFLNDARFARLACGTRCVLSNYLPGKGLRRRCLRAKGAKHFHRQYLFQTNSARRGNGWRVGESYAYGPSGAGPDGSGGLLRVGFYGAESRVRAWFDDVRMVKTGAHLRAGCELCDPCARGQ